MNTFPNKIEPLEFNDDNCVIVKYLEKVHIEVDDMANILNKISAFTGNQPAKRLIIITKNSTISREARALLQEQNHLHRKEIIAEAVVVTSLAQKMATNFYLSFIKDDFPSKFFTDLGKANEWLRSF